MRVTAEPRTFTLSDVARHRSKGDCWIVVDEAVLDVSRFAAVHPGGEQLLVQAGGRDATEEFYGLHRKDVLRKFRGRLQIGVVEGRARPADDSICDIPFTEFLREHRPCYGASHLALRAYLRAFLAEHVADVAEECERTEAPVPPEIHRKLGEAGIYAAANGPKLVPPEFAARLPPAIAHGRLFDYHHEAVLHSEFARLLTPGFEDGLFGGRHISVPPILWFAQPAVSAAVVPAILRGEQQAALAITEPFAGSDVRALRTTMERSDCGEYWTVNGTKKWITEGLAADHFVTLCVDKASGAQSMLLISVADSPGVTTKLIKSVYSSAANTATVEFENVRVPARNLLGKEGDGFRICMKNFNHERWVTAVKMVARARRVIEESLKWAIQRRAFGKRLIDQVAIQEKLAAAVSRCEACQCWLETITDRLDALSFEEQNERLAGEIALVKYEAAQLGHVVADAAVVTLGGRAMTKGGMGGLVERYQRTYRLAGTYGGSTDVMATLGIRQGILRRLPPGGASRL
eukprot:g1273.t1